jgi:hypothetical protein
MIELRGTIVEDGLLKFQISAPNSLQSPIRCSDLRMIRTKEGARSTSLDGTYEGQYTCSGSLTQATLVLAQRPGGLQLEGTFRFSAKTFPNRDRTEAGCVCRFAIFFNTMLLRTHTPPQANPSGTTTMSSLLTESVGARKRKIPRTG